MEECPFCDGNAFYLCTTCNTFFCKAHKLLHDQIKKGVHIFEDLRRKLSSTQISKIVENLSIKIKAGDELRVKIVEETKSLIHKTRTLCKEAINTINEKQKKYINLLISIEKGSITQLTKEIKSQLKTLIIVSVPHHEFTEIEKFYAMDFYKESRFLSQLSTMNRVDALNLLEKDYGLYIESHKSPITCVATSSRYIVTSSNDNSIRIWNVEDRKQVGVFRGYTSSIKALEISTDSKYIVTISYSKLEFTVMIWNINYRRQEAVLQGHRDVINSIAITTDSKYIVSGSNDRTVRVWNLQEKIIEAVLTGHESHVISVTISRDNKRIASASDSTIRIWNLQDKTQEFILEESNVYKIAFTIDSNYLVSHGYYDYLINIRWNQRQSIGDHGSSCQSILITNDNKYIIFIENRSHCSMEHSRHHSADLSCGWNELLH